MKGLSTLLLAVAALLVAGPGAAQDIAYRVTIPPGIAADHAIAPGATIAAGEPGSIGFTLHNDSASGGMASFGGYLESRAEAFGDYTFVATDPLRCPAPIVETGLADLPRAAFVVGPIAANASLTCSYRITRSIDSVDDLKLRLCGSRSGSGFCERIFRRGTLPDQSLSVEAASVPGVSVAPNQALVRVRLRNHSAVDGVSRDVTTECSEFEGGWFAPGPFTTDTDFPGGCPRSDHFGPGCLNFTGQNFMNYAFRLGPAAAQGESTCLVRLQFETAAMRATSVDFYLADDHVLRSDGGVAFDAATTNDATLLGGVPGAGASGAVTVPLPTAILPLLALLLGGIGVARLRRR
jgi:hypothetical protein